MVSVVNLTSEIKASLSSSSRHDNCQEFVPGGAAVTPGQTSLLVFLLPVTGLTEPSHQRELLKAENQPELRFTPPASVVRRSNCRYDADKLSFFIKCRSNKI